MNNIVAGLKILLFLLAALISSAQAANITIIPQKNSAFILEQLTQGLGVPWGMAFLNRDELIFTERSGDIKLLNLNSLKITTVVGAPIVATNGQGGMLDVAIGPNYTQSGWIYFTFFSISSYSL